MGMDAPSQIFTAIGLLVIEDSEDDFTLLLRKLRSGGMQVMARRVQTSSALLDALKNASFDAVIADHRLPQFTSLEALRLVRQFDPDLPFVIVSGTIGEELAVEAMRAGADDYLMKDKLVRLVPALERALKVAASRRGRRKAEAALKESELRFGALTANLPGMVFQLRCMDGALSLLYVSEGSRRVLGLTPDQLVDDAELLFAGIEPADAAELRGALQEAAEEFPYIQWSGTLRSPDATQLRWIELAARSRRTASGATLWDGIVSDTTAQRKDQQQLHDLASHLTRVREEEREVIAREIHDDVGSTLTAVKFDIAWLKGELRQTPRLASKLQQVDQLVDSVIMSSTRIMHDLRPGILDEGIVASLEWQAQTFEQRMSIPCAFRASHEHIELDRDQAIALFRVCQEALNNIAKHAGATRVDIRLDATDESLLLEISDDGKGIGVADRGKRECFGLRGMQERARSLGGTLDIAGNQRGGTTITLSLHLPRRMDEALRVEEGAQR
jgi:two-component system, NarL family, sensor histidine kinase UhpB